MRRFNLVRKEDETGVSDIEIVAEGIQFTSGVCVLSWLTEPKSVTAIYDNINIVELFIVGDSKTIVKWIDDIDYFLEEYGSIENVPDKLKERT